MCLVFQFAPFLHKLTKCVAKVRNRDGHDVAGGSFTVKENKYSSKFITNNILEQGPSDSFLWSTAKCNLKISVFQQYFLKMKDTSIIWKSRACKDTLTVGMSYTHIMLPTILRISKYMWLIYYLFLKFIPLFMFRIFIQAAYRYTVIGVPVIVQVPRFQKPCCRTGL